MAKKVKTGNGSKKRSIVIISLQELETEAERIKIVLKYFSKSLMAKRKVPKKQVSATHRQLTKIIKRVWAEKNSHFSTEVGIDASFWRRIKGIM